MLAFKLESGLQRVGILLLCSISWISSTWTGLENLSLRCTQTLIPRDIFIGLLLLCWEELLLGFLENWYVLIAAVHFPTLPVTNAKPWSHPLLTVLQPRWSLPSPPTPAGALLPAVRDVVVQSGQVCLWTAALGASALKPLPQVVSRLPPSILLSLLKCLLGTGESRPLTKHHKPLPYLTPTALTTCLPA